MPLPAIKGSPQTQAKVDETLPFILTAPPTVLSPTHNEPCRLQIINKWILWITTVIVCFLMIKSNFRGERVIWLMLPGQQRKSRQTPHRDTASWIALIHAQLAFLYNLGLPVQDCCCPQWAGTSHIDHQSRQAILIEAGLQLRFSLLRCL